MSFEFLRETVLGSGFAAQYASRFDDAFEGVAGIRINGVQVPMQLASSAFNQYYSILCFNKTEETKHNHEMLMWSLYANKNRGVRIVLDLPGSDFMSTPYAAMGNVQYDPKIKLIDVTPPPLEDLLKNCLNVTALANIEWIKSMYFFKHPCWEWEKEYRVVIANNELEGVISKTNPDKNGESRYCAAFLKEYIVGVDFGLNLWRDRGIEVANVIDEIRAVREDLTFRAPVCLSNQKSFGFEVISR